MSSAHNYLSHLLHGTNNMRSDQNYLSRLNNSSHLFTLKNEMTEDL